MKALIIEDEPLAQNNLRNIIMKQFDNLEIVGMLSSVKGAIQWLENPIHKVDIIFLDVELSDGMCFDIFEKVKTNAKIIITTAYDTYAIKAFKINSIDYLLKPIDPNELKCAVDRCSISSKSESIDINTL
ncbi:MAG: response regulator, partial [Alistipes sp.]|nr:response regulator [Alistipes sp.]